MNVRMPDGTVIENVPDGVTQSELLNRYQRMVPAPAAPQADDPGAFMAGVIGAGRVVDQAVKGVKQKYHEFTGNKNELARMENEEAQNKEIYGRLSAQHPIATTVGEIAPLLGALPVAGSIGGAAAVSSLPGLVSYGSTDERLTSGALGAAGGALGAGAGKLLGRVLNPVRASSAVAPEVTQAAQRLGYRPTVGQETGSRTLQVLEQQAAKNPLSSGGAQAYNQANAKALNTAALRAMGETGDELTEEAFAAARTRIGGEFDRLAANKTVPLGKDFTARLQALKTRVDAAGPFKNTQAADTLENAALVARSGRVTGEVYQAIRSELTDMSRVASRAGNDKLAGSIKGVRQAFDDAAEKALSPDDMQAWKVARAQYAAMKTLEKRGAVKGGNVDPAIIRNQMQSSSPGAYARGTMKGDLADIARIGNAFRPLPDSGTASNMVGQLLLTGGAGLAGPGALATSLLAPLAANKMLFSKAGQKYLRNGLLKVDDEMEKSLVRGGYGLLGMPLVAAGQ